MRLGDASRYISDVSTYTRLKLNIDANELAEQ